MVPRGLTDRCPLGHQRPMTRRMPILTWSRKVALTVVGVITLLATGIGAIPNSQANGSQAPSSAIAADASATRRALYSLSVHARATTFAPFIGPHDEASNRRFPVDAIIYVLQIVIHPAQNHFVVIDCRGGFEAAISSLRFFS